MHLDTGLIFFSTAILVVYAIVFSVFAFLKGRSYFIRDLPPAESTLVEQFTELVKTPWTGVGKWFSKAWKAFSNLRGK